MRPGKRPVYRALAHLLIVFTTLGSARTAFAWGTVEHVLFGERIAEPYETLLDFPRDDMGKKRLPVQKVGINQGTTATQSPSTFGHVVSAPDFARSLTNFYNDRNDAAKTAKRARKSESFKQYLPERLANFARAREQALENRIPTFAESCRSVWSAMGENFQGLNNFDLSGPDLTARVAKFKEKLTALAKDGTAAVDCLEFFSLNNDHFGDFARVHYQYYHGLALEAARRYHYNRKPVCQAVAYTMEGWGQHYLTDSTAAGHGWNPPGTYEETVKPEVGANLQVSSSVTVRMRIHNFINQQKAKGGSRFAAPLFQEGQAFGDEAEDVGFHGASGEKYLPEDMKNWQTIRTLAIGQAALGQVVATAECGAPSVDEAAPVTDRPEWATMSDYNKKVRENIYVSNQTMCAAMFGHEIREPKWGYVRNFFAGLFDYKVTGNMKTLADQCLAASVDSAKPAAITAFAKEGPGNAFAKGYFTDGKAISDVLDADTRDVDLKDIGCDDKPWPNQPAAVDMCGNVLPATPKADGQCTGGMEKKGDFCYPVETNDAPGATMTPFQYVKGAGGIVDLPTAGPVQGDAVEFVWASIKDLHVDADQVGQAGPLDTFATLEPKGEAPRKDQASFAVWESQVVVPKFADNQQLTLRIADMDEGIKVQVNGEAVAYVTRTDLDRVGGVLNVPLTTTQPVPYSGTHNNPYVKKKERPIPRLHAIATKDGKYVVRLVSVNSEGTRRNVVATLAFQTYVDAQPQSAADDGFGCSTLPGRTGTGAGLGVLGLTLAALFLRRRRRNRK
jgi:hypothetical protein